MRWFREKIRNGAWLALIALAINLGLSFGHVHALDGRHSEGGVRALIAAVTGSQAGDQTPSRPGDLQPDYLCPICMAAFAMGNAVAATPPTLQVEFAYASIDRAIEPVAALVEPQRAAFRSRGPPVS
jgi:hypothetical protein